MTAIDSGDSANTLADSIIEERLAACVQIMPKMRSVYRWKDKIESSDEFLLLIKTSTEKYTVLEEFINDVHPYETPEIIALEVNEVSEKYFNWLMVSVAG